MKTIKINVIKCLALSCLGVCIILFMGCSADQVTLADEEAISPIENNETRASGPSASGHGTFDFENIPIDAPGKRQFSFHAREKNNGTVSGSGVVNYTRGGIMVKYDIDCLNVIGNTAILSGSITKWRDNPDGVGSLIYLKVTDNGEGNNAAPDQMALVSFGTDPTTFDCGNDFGVAMYDIEGGNVQVNE